jgi:competence protein ComEC
VVTPFLRDRGARSVSLFVLSHPHLDHVGGAGALFRTFRVDRVLDAGNPAPSGPYAEFLDAVREEGASWLPAADEARLRLDGVEITVLGPDAGGGALWEGGAREANEASVAVRVRIGEGFVYLNTGDASVEQEAAILARWPRDSLRAILLKVGHHGSRTASSSDWLEAVRPSLAVISAGPGLAGTARSGDRHRERATGGDPWTDPSSR